MKKLLILLLVFVTLIPSCASAIDIRKEGTVYQGGMRTPSLTRVSADYENGIITIGVNGYTGGIQVLVSDSQDNNVHGKEWTDAQWDAWCDQYDKFC